MRSLQARLSIWLSLTVLSLVGVAGVVSSLSAFHDAIDAQDDQLRLLATLLDRQHVEPVATTLAEDPTETELEARIAVQPLSLVTSIASDSASALPGLAGNLREGFQTVQVRGDAWRVYVMTLSTGTRIAVGQETAKRDEVARESALQTIAPPLLLLAVLPLLVRWLVRKMLLPLQRAAMELDQRTEQDLQEVADTGLPTEVAPFVVAINRLLHRVSESVSLQRRFIADATHELRSPLTALSLQAERLESADLSDQARQRVLRLRGGIERARASLDQMLTLARVQGSAEAAAVPVSMARVIALVLEDLMPLAAARNIDLGAVDLTDAHVPANEFDLLALVNNLVDNAIRYTPEGGRVDLALRVRAQHVVFQVSDTGPGIPPEEHARIFDPFYRVPGSKPMGSGLGLNIVRTIATRLGATIHMRYANPEDSTGLSVQVLLPADLRDARPGEAQ